MTSLYSILRVLKSAPENDAFSALIGSIMAQREPVPGKPHYQTSDGSIYCTNTGLRYALKE